MRHLFFMLMSCLIPLFTGCTSGFLQEPVLEKGGVRIYLDQGASEGEVRTKADLALPDVADFEVEIYDIQGNRRYRDTYGNSADSTIPLNAGTHRLLAQYGDSTGVGFNSLYFIADQEFEVKGQEVTPIHAVARIGKVKVSVEFGESITTIYKDWYAQVRTAEDKVLRFSKDEMRSGYFPAGNLVLEVYVQENGQWKVFKAQALECKAGESVTFTLNTNLNNGILTAHVTVDNAVEQVDKTITIPSSMAPKEKPSITMKGVEGTSFQLYEACRMEDAVCQADIVAAEGISSCIFDLTASSIPGLPAGQYDLISPTPEVRSTLEEAGLAWLRDMGQKRLSYVNFSGLMDYIGKTSVYDPADNRLAEFRLVVTDGTGCETASQTYSFDVIPSEAEVRIADTDIWASEMKKTTVDVLAGEPSLFQLQYRKLGTTDYMTVDPLSISGKQVTFGAIPALDPGTVYELRAIYNGNPYNVTPETSFTTEAPLQIGNAGFEDWTENIFNFNVILAAASSQKWWQPWVAQGEQWWAVNSKTAMQGKPSNWNFTYKIFPTAGYTGAVSASGKSAQVATIAVDGWAIPGKGGYATKIGELWIGTADDNGNHTSDGHAFASRPSQLSYWVLNRPVKGESTRVLLEVRAADGTVIGKAEKVDNKVDQNGRKEILDIVYTDKTKKAASIFISIKSSTAGAPAYSDTTIEFAGTTYNVHAGSKINVDDIHLLY